MLMPATRAANRMASATVAIAIRFFLVCVFMIRWLKVRATRSSVQLRLPVAHGFLLFLQGGLQLLLLGEETLLGLFHRLHVHLVGGLYYLVLSGKVELCNFGFGHFLEFGNLRLLRGGEFDAGRLFAQAL